MVDVQVLGLGLLYLVKAVESNFSISEVCAVKN